MNIRARQDALVRHLRRSGHVSIDELAHVAQVSRRTVLRDIAALRDQGFVIDSEPGRGGGLVLDPASVQLTAKLNADEVFALLISVSVMRAAGTLPFGQLADAGLAKVEKALPRDRVRDLREILRLEDGYTIYHTGDSGVFKDMELIHDLYKPDLVLICIGGWFTMDPGHAAYAVNKFLKPATVMPMHYGTFKPLKGTPAQFKEHLDKMGDKSNVVVMNPGDEMTFGK